MQVSDAASMRAASPCDVVALSVIKASRDDTVSAQIPVRASHTHTHTHTHMNMKITERIWHVRNEPITR